MDENVSITVYRTNVVVGKEFTLHFTLKNVGTHSYESLLLYLEESTLNDKSLAIVGPLGPKGVTKEVKLSVAGGIDVTIADIPNYFTATLVEESNPEVPIQNKLFVISADCFCSTLNKYKNPTTSDGKFNILIFGIAGSTKSSFINSVYTLTAKNDGINMVAKVGGGADHSTKQFQRYEFDNLPFNIWDAWGVDNKNYGEFELKRILAGEMPNNYKMGMNWNAIKKNADLLERIQSTKADRKIHQVIFFIPYSADDAMLTRAKKFFEEISDVVGNAVVVLTKVDTVLKEVRGNPLGCDDNNILKKKKEVQKALAIPLNRIFLGVNYMNEGKKSLPIDRNNLYIINEALANAYHFLSKGVTLNRNIELDVKPWICIIPELKKLHDNANSLLINLKERNGKISKVDFKAQELEKNAKELNDMLIVVNDRMKELNNMMRPQTMIVQNSPRNRSVQEHLQSSPRNRSVQEHLQNSPRNAFSNNINNLPLRPAVEETSQVNMQVKEQSVGKSNSLLERVKFWGNNKK